MVPIAGGVLLGALVASAAALHVHKANDCECKTWHEAYTTKFHSCKNMQRYVCDDLLLNMKKTNACLSDFDIEPVSDFWVFRNSTEQYCIVDAKCSDEDAHLDQAPKWNMMPGALLWKRKRCGADDAHFNQKTIEELAQIASTEGLDLGMLAKFAYPVVNLHAVTGTLYEELKKLGTYGMVVNDGSSQGSLYPLPPFDVVTICGIFTIQDGYPRVAFEEKEFRNSATCEQNKEKDAQFKVLRLAREKQEREAAEERMLNKRLENLNAEEFHWEEGAQLNCYQKAMVIPAYKNPLDAIDPAQCQTHCANQVICHGVTFVAHTKKCFLRQNVDLSGCKKSDAHMTYKKLEAKDPKVAAALAKRAISA